jgi:transcriptional regulator with XRE-family HTH domain
LNIGEKIRKMRESKDFSMRKVAEMAGISASLVSQIETGKVDPSLNTLRKLSFALDTPLFYFVIDEESSNQSVVKLPDRREVIFPDAGLTYQIIHSNPQKKMGIHIGTLAPGGGTSKDLLFHEGEECIVIIDGQMEVNIEKKLINLTEGDSIYFDSSAPHRLFKSWFQRLPFLADNYSSEILNKYLLLSQAVATGIDSKQY